MSFKHFFYARKRNEKIEELLLEHESYELIPGTKNSRREDSGNTNTKTQVHSHVFAKPKGKGKQLYAVNVDGSGHDGSSGIEISKKHADFFRDEGYEVPDTNILESIESDSISEDEYVLVLLEE